MTTSIIHIAPKMIRGGGIENIIMNYYRHLNQEEFEFIFVVPTIEEADFDQEIQNLGGRIIPVISRQEHFIKNILNTYKILSREKQAKIVHIHVVDASRIVDGMIAKLCGKKVIFHSHTIYPNLVFKDRIKRKIRAPFFRLFGNYFFACSAEAGQYFFGDKIINSQHFSIMKNAISLNKYIFQPAVRHKVREEFGIDKEFVIGQVGRFSNEKNHDFTLKIFSELLKQNSNSRLLLVGDGPLFTQIKEQVQKLGIEDKVIFTGTRSDVPQLMQGMDALIFPSKYEGLGMAVIEAQASGLSCVVSSKVPQETKITEVIEYLSLDDEPTKWVNSLLKISNEKKEQRQPQVEKLKKSGYEIESAAKWLKDYYQMLEK